MAEVQDSSQNTGGSTPFRIDIQVHDLLMNPAQKQAIPPSLAPKDDTAPGLPVPVYPQGQYVDGQEMTLREYQNLNTKRTLKAWAWPFVKSRFHGDELRPIITYLFTEFKCNVDCHYCWSFNNAVKGMTEQTARASIDWIHSIGGRVLALMGGEPLLRPDFVHKITYYAAKKGYYVYLPTNGRLMRPEVIDRIGDAGVGIFNLAIDAVEEKPGLPKALNRIRPYFEYLVKNQHKYGYAVMVNINITHINMADVRELTEIARDHGVATDYHINEAPMLEQSHFRHLEDNSTYLTPDDFPKVDALLDELMEKNTHGYKMANPVQHMRKMKLLMRGKIEPWSCRAGQNNLIIRTDGTLAPCFPMYSATYDWGTVGHHKFDVKQLTEMKKSCSTGCLSTCNFILSHAYDTGRVIKWGVRQAMHGFRGATGSFAD